MSAPADSPSDREPANQGLGGSISEDAKAKLAAALGGSVGAAAEDPTASVGGKGGARKAKPGADAADAEGEEAGVLPSLARIIEAATGLPLEDITPDSRLEDDLSIDSLSQIDIITEAEDRFGVRIEESEVSGEMTIRQFAEMVEALQQGK